MGSHYYLINLDHLNNYYAFLFPVPFLLDSYYKLLELLNLLITTSYCDSSAI